MRICNIERFFFYPIMLHSLDWHHDVSCMSYINDPYKMAQWNMRKLPRSTFFSGRFLSNGFTSKLKSGWLFYGVKSDVYTQFCYMDLYEDYTKAYKSHNGRIPGSLSAIVPWNVKKAQLITAHPVIEWLSWAVTRFVRIPINQRIFFNGMSHQLLITAHLSTETLRGSKPRSLPSVKMLLLKCLAWISRKGRQRGGLPIFGLNNYCVLIMKERCWWRDVRRALKSWVFSETSWTKQANLTKLMGGLAWISNI